MGLKLVKELEVDDVNGNGVDDLGDVGHYRFRVESTGNVSLSNVTIDDPTLNLVDHPCVSLLLGGAVAYCDAPTETDRTITYTFSVENTGNVTLAPVTITDGNLDPATWTCLDALAPGATGSCTATYTLTSDDVAATLVTNTATATGTPPTPDGGTPPAPVTDDDTVTTPVRNPALTIDKVASGDGPFRIGETITYTITVTNAGNLALDTVVVTDRMCTPGRDDATDVGADDVLSPTESWTYRCDHQVNEEDVAGPSLTNAATDVTIDDPMLGGRVCDPVTLAVGTSTTCTRTYTLQAPDIGWDLLTNTATVSGDDHDDRTDNPTDEATAETPTGPPMAELPALRLVKSARLIDSDDDGLGQVGEMVDYAFTVTNTGNVGLIDVEIDDPMFGGQICVVGALRVGASATCGPVATCGPIDRVVTEVDAATDVIPNVATATGDDGDPSTPNPIDQGETRTPADVYVPPDPGRQAEPTTTVAPSTTTVAPPAPTTLPSGSTAPPAGPPAGAPAPAPAPPGGAPPVGPMPATGSTTSGMVPFALVLIAVGAAIVMTTRRRHPAERRNR